jgi:hypothetical protein
MARGGADRLRIVSKVSINRLTKERDCTRGEAARDRDIRVADEPAPTAAAGQTLVRVTAVGICGSSRRDAVTP